MRTSARAMRHESRTTRTVLSPESRQMTPTSATRSPRSRAAQSSSTSKANRSSTSDEKIGATDEADAGDETARALVAEVGRALGQGLADLAAIFDPELIVVGGLEIQALGARTGLLFDPADVGGQGLEHVRIV